MLNSNTKYSKLPNILNYQSTKFSKFYLTQEIVRYNSLQPCAERTQGPTSSRHRGGGPFWCYVGLGSREAAPSTLTILTGTLATPAATSLFT